MMTSKQLNKALRPELVVSSYMRPSVGKRMAGVLITLLRTLTSRFSGGSPFNRVK